MTNNNTFGKLPEDLSIMNNYSSKRPKDYNRIIENILYDAIAECSDEEVEQAQKSIDDIYNECESKVLAYVGKSNHLVVSDYLGDLSDKCENEAYRLGFNKAMDIMLGYILEKSISQPIH
ncbi:MAG: hypothetical protein LIO87_09510 [Eubacterium sp.]|nr:hypothetical protein [Eubacterium sp.]